jgi:hypothetical protein
LHFGEKTFFDVVAYYKHEPSEFHLCIDEGLRVPVNRAPYTATVQLIGTGLPERKQYQFDLNRDGDLTFTEVKALP